MDVHEAAVLDYCRNRQLLVFGTIDSDTVDTRQPSDKRFPQFRSYGRAVDPPRLSAV